MSAWPPVRAWPQKTQSPQIHDEICGLRVCCGRSSPSAADYFMSALVR
jgi:hypothetical protein